MLKESSVLVELHKIREDLYEEEKNLTEKEKIKRTRGIVVKFEKEYGIKLKKASM